MRAATFIYNSATPFTRTMQGFRLGHYAAKGWMAPWEESADSARRESWSVDPLPNGFQSIVNGHMLWDNQWEFWNSGGHYVFPENGSKLFANDGWSSGETFMLHDGAFLKASLLLEDWLVPSAGPRENPYDITRLTFFDTTHIERAGTKSGFDDPERTSFAQASRAATDFAIAKGFGSGRFTGHYLGERFGLLCLPTGSIFIDATYDEIADTGFGFLDIDTTHWAKAGRAANAIALANGFAAGFFTGHQLNSRRGVIALPQSMVTIVDVPRVEIEAADPLFQDIDTVSWARAARAATTYCLDHGLLGGFLSGQELDGRYRIIVYTH